LLNGYAMDAKEQRVATAKEVAASLDSGRTSYSELAEALNEKGHWRTLHLG
jgi:hypothetical protein